MFDEVKYDTELAQTIISSIKNGKLEYLKSGFQLPGDKNQSDKWYLNVGGYYVIFQHTCPWSHMGVEPEIFVYHDGKYIDGVFDRGAVQILNEEHAKFVDKKKQESLEDIRKNIFLGLSKL